MTDMNHDGGKPGRIIPAGRSARSGPGFAALTLIGAVILTGFFLFGMLPRTARNARLRQRANAAAAERPTVPAARLKTAPRSDLALPGTAGAIVDAVVASRTSGYVSKRLVDIGDHVKVGQTLAIIESPDVDQQLYQAQAQESQSHAMTQQALADLANKQATVSQFRSNVSQALANVEQANAQLTDARAKLAQLSAAKATAEAQAEEARHQVEIKQAALAQAQTQASFADITNKRYKNLLASGFVAQQDADQAEAAYKNAVAAVTSAKADLNASQANVKAADQLVLSAQANIESGQAQVQAAQKGISASQATVRSNEATVNAAQANVQSGQSSVSASLNAERASKFNSKHYAVLTSFERVVAPFSGVITARNVDVGTLVSAGGGAGGNGGGSASSTLGSASNAGSASSGSAAPSTASGGGLFGIARTDIIRVLITVPETYSRVIRAGLSARINIREFPGRAFHGTVARVAGALDNNSRTLLAEVHIANTDNAILPGMFAEVHFDLANPAGDYRVPASAVIYDAKGTRVAVIDKNDTIHFINVKVVKDYGKEIDIQDGLTGVETLVVNPTDDLVEGEAVRPQIEGGQ